MHITGRGTTASVASRFFTVVHNASRHGTYPKHGYQIMRTFGVSRFEYLFSKKVAAATRACRYPSTAPRAGARPGRCKTPARPRTASRCAGGKRVGSRCLLCLCCERAVQVSVYTCIQYMCVCARAWRWRRRWCLDVRAVGIATHPTRLQFSGVHTTTTTRR